MSTRTIAAVAAAAVIVIVAAAVAVWPRSPWSLHDPEARRAWEAALRAEQKLYAAEELRELERVLEREPGYAPAAIQAAQLVRGSNPERARELAEAARAAPLERFTPRERFLIELWLALWDRDLERGSEVIDRYTRRLADDPLVLNARARRAWMMGRIAEAERLYRRVLELEPNRVVAYNQLAYLAMSRGDFREAERLLVTYRFIAPDQANPHDSLGELYTITGRYDEARREFEAALAVFPGFWASATHLAVLALVENDPARAEEAVARAREVPDAPRQAVAEAACLVRTVTLARSGRWQELLELARGPCTQPRRTVLPALLFHTAYLELDRREEALTLERRLEERLRAPDEPSTEEARLRAVVHWMQARRARREGRDPDAVELLLDADRGFAYQGVMEALLKLQVRLERADVLRGMGRREEAERLVREVERVNPKIAAAYRGRRTFPFPG